MLSVMYEVLPEVTRLKDDRGRRPPDAAGVGGFWYEPEIWALPLPPASRVLYAALCSYLTHGEINRHDLRGALKSSSDEEISEALDTLVQHGLLRPIPEGYAVNPVSNYRA